MVELFKKIYIQQKKQDDNQFAALVDIDDDADDEIGDEFFQGKIYLKT